MCIQIVIRVSKKVDNFMHIFPNQQALEGISNAPKIRQSDNPCGMH